MSRLEDDNDNHRQNIDASCLNDDDENTILDFIE